MLGGRAISAVCYISSVPSEDRAHLEEKVAELEDAYHRLERQSRQNELILGSVGEGIFGIDRRGRYWRD